MVEAVVSPRCADEQLSQAGAGERRLPAAADGASVVPAMASASANLLAIPHFRQLVMVQVLFWSASAVFLMLPKYLALQLHADAIWIGLIMGGLGLGAVTMAPMIGWLSRRWGRRRCLVAANLLMAAGSLLFVGVTAPGPLAVFGRCLHGMAGALLYAHGTVLVIDLVPRSRLPSAIALFMTAGLVPNIISPPLAEWLLASHGPTVVFLGAGLVALVGAVLATRLPDATPPVAAMPSSSIARPAPALLIVSMLFGLAAGIVFTFHQPLALQRGLLHVSGFLVTFTLTATSLRLVGGRTIDRLGSGRVACWTGAGYSLVMLGLAAMQPGMLPLLGICFGATHGLFYPTFVAFALSRGDGRGRETRMAWIGAADKLGYLAVVTLGPLARAYGYPLLFMLSSASLAIGVMLLRRTTTSDHR